MFSLSTQCHQGREFVSYVNDGKMTIWQMVQNTKNCRRLFSRNPDPGIVVFEGKMPAELKSPNLMGQPIMIGSRGDFHIFQCVTRFDRYINFVAIDTKTEEVQLFRDTSNYVQKSWAMSNPVECHISPNLDLIIFRLSQEVLTRRKWSKVLIARNTECRVTASDMNSNVGDVSKISISGTVDSSLRDCRDQAITVHPFYPRTVVTAWVDEFCSKCTLTLYQVGPGGERVKLKEQKHKIIISSMQPSRGNESDQEEEETFFLKTDKVSMAFCKSGEVLVVCVYAVNNPQPDYMNYYEGSYHHYFVKLLQFNPETLELISSCSHSALVNYADSQFYLFFSTCDSSIQIWDYNDEIGKLRIVKVLEVPLRKPINLKSLCREKILGKVRIDKVGCLPLPQQMLTYLRFQ